MNTLSHNRKELGCELIASAVRDITYWTKDLGQSQLAFLAEFFPLWATIPNYDLLSAIDTIYSNDLEDIIDTYELQIRPDHVRDHARKLYVLAHETIANTRQTQPLPLPMLEIPHPTDLNSRRTYGRWVAKHKTAHVLYCNSVSFFKLEVAL